MNGCVVPPWLAPTWTISCLLLAAGVGAGVGFAGKSGKRKPTKAFPGIGVGVGLLIVNVNVWVPVPFAFVALRVMLYVLAVVGVPEIKPVPVLTVRPAGNGAAPHVVIAWSAVI